MKFSKFRYLSILTFIVLFSTPMILGAMNVNKTILLKKDGSGSITLTYFAKESEVKAKNNLIGNFPFTEDNVNEYFKSSGTNVHSSKLETRPNDNSSKQMTVVVTFSDITKLSLMKAFSDVDVTYTETDSGKVLKDIMTPAFVKTNSIQNVYIAFKYDDVVKSSNGKLNDKNSYIWFRGDEYVDGKSNLVFWANLPSNVSKGNETKESNDSEKSCGLFGLELPIIILAGLTFSSSYRRKKSRKN